MATQQTVDAEPVGSLEPSSPDRPCTAESAECTCPDFCERDHDND